MATSFSLPCGDCPEYMYDYTTIKTAWMTSCSNESPEGGTEATKFFKRMYNRHLEKTVFVTAFDCSDTAKLFVDYVIYTRIKSRLQRCVGFKVPHLPPVRLSKRKLPCCRHMFASEGDFNRCIENLKRKNDEILFQKNVRGIRILDQIRARVDGNVSHILALDLEVFEENPSKILEIGCVLFRMVSLETSAQIIACNHYVITDNKHYKNKCLMPDNRDKFKFGDTREVSMSEGRKLVEYFAKKSDYITAHASTSLAEYLGKQGFNLHGVEVVDTKLLHIAVCPFVAEHAQRNLRWLMKDLEIPLEYSNNNNNNNSEDQVLNNAGNGAFYTMEVFKTLVRMKPFTSDYD